MSSIRIKKDTGRVKVAKKLFNYLPVFRKNKQYGRYNKYLLERRWG